MSGDKQTIVAPSMEGAKMSRGTMKTDKWRALNADVFDMKLQVKVIND